MISVIVPVYNVEKHLRKCLDSIVNQTYRNLEIILVDDGSPDNCGSICDEYAQADDRIRVIHKTNGGLSSARNAGMDAATGDYIAFVDSDDWVDLDTYEILHKLAVETDADITEGGYRFYRPWKPERVVLEGENTKTITTYTGKEALERLYFGPQLFSDVSIMVVTKLYKTSLVKNIRFLEGYIYEDINFTPRVLYAAKKHVKYDRSFYSYNIHLGSESIHGSKMSVYKLSSKVYSTKYLMDFFVEHPIDKISEYTCSQYYNALAEAYLQCFNRRKEPDFNRKRKEIGAEIKAQRKQILENAYCTPGWKYQLLVHSPSLFSVVTNMYRKRKAAAKRK